MAVRKLGPYVVDRLLGRGGMGAVFAAVNEETGVPAAVKVLASAHAGDERFRHRFESEIETLKKLKHPNIVELFGYGEHEGELFFAMELVEGQSLQDELRKGRDFTWKEVVHFGVDVCAALKHAHDRGVVHRDLKPANLLLTTQGTVKLTDFGIAKLFGGTQLTADGSVIGTADYMSPEQASGRPVTARSDLYSLGSVLYTLLARRPPFADVALHQVVHKLCYEDPPPLRKLAIGAPLELVNLVEQLLAKDPAKRIATAHALSNRLRAAEFVVAARDDEERQRERDAASPQPPEGREATPSPGVTPPRRAKLDSIHEDAGEFLTPLGPDDEDRTSLHDTHAGKPTRYNPDKDAEHEPLPPDELRLAPDSYAPTGISSGYPSAPVARGQPTSAWQSQQTVGPARPATSESQGRSSSRFTAVDDEVRRRAESSRSDSDGPPLWVKAVVGAGGFIAMGIALAVGGYFALRPPSADSLYAKIEAAANSDDPRELLSVTGEMNEFERRFADDPRASRVADFQEDLKLYKLQRRFDLRTRRLHRQSGLNAAEGAYVQAMEVAKTDPDAALSKMEALVDLLAASPPQDKTTRQIAELAQEQLSRMKKSQALEQASHMKLIRERMAAADKAAKDRPAEAERIWRGIVQLYGDRPWAASPVADAKRRLAKTSE